MNPSEVDALGNSLVVFSNDNNSEGIWWYRWVPLKLDFLGA